MSFTETLMHWDENFNERTMPWKGIHNPYKIWLSEVILQQTRVAQGLSYFLRFTEKYPTIDTLAQAKDEEVFKLWEGLGYYNRCRNLLYTARKIVQDYNSVFPQKYDEILALKGVGPYTAAAIASFAFNLPYAVVDGNVFRVLARYFGKSTPIDTTEGKLLFSELAQKVLDKKQAGKYNQAIMDFGATICTPMSPNCNQCPLQKNCDAYATGTVQLLPIKEKRLEKKNRFFNWFVIECQKKYFIVQRQGNDIWQQLFEFYLSESDKKVNWTHQNVAEWTSNNLGMTPDNIEISKEQKQQLTHQNISAVFIHIQLKKRPSYLSFGIWVDKSELKNYAFPKLPKLYIDKLLNPQGTLFEEC